MRQLQLLLETWRTVRYRPVAAALILIVVAATCATTLFTVGRTAASERDVAARLEAAGSRELTITDTADQHVIPADLVELMDTASGVQKVIAYANPVDVHNPELGQGATAVPAWTITGKLSYAGTLTAGRLPRAGEAIASTRALEDFSLDAPLGSIEATDGSIYPIVGTFTAEAPFDDFTNGVLIAGDGSQAPTTLRLLMQSATDVPGAQTLALSLIQPPDPSSLRVESPTALADLQNTIGRDLSSSNRGLMLLILAAGTSLTALITAADVLMRRSDLGRRRALGATRLDLVQLVVLRTVYPALTGAIIGSVAGQLGAEQAGIEVPTPFTIGTAVLALLASLVAALGPALFAANRDPVQELRTP